MILDDIITNKKAWLSIQKKITTINQLEDLANKSDEVIDFASALKKNLGAKNRIIAEVKKASPSKGVICEKFLPVEIAGQYEENGAVAVSVLTDEKYFMGKIAYLTEIKKKYFYPGFKKRFFV